MILEERTSAVSSTSARGCWPYAVAPMMSWLKRRQNNRAAIQHTAQGSSWKDSSGRSSINGFFWQASYSLHYARDCSRYETEGMFRLLRLISSLQVRLIFMCEEIDGPRIVSEKVNGPFGPVKLFVRNAGIILQDDLRFFRTYWRMIVNSGRWSRYDAALSSVLCVPQPLRKPEHARMFLQILVREIVGKIVECFYIALR